jgi:hypothetical protein
MYTDFFKKIDTEEKAYWLGFIAADGNVDKNKRVCSIQLKQSDKGHLEKFSKVFNDYYHISLINSVYPSARISIYSKQCCLDLEQYGITPNKSLTLDINFNLIPKELILHFIRGYFDGDGSIFCSIPKRENGYNYEEWGCNFVGTEKVLTYFKEYLNLENKITKKGNVYSLDINGILKTYQVLTLLYKDSTIFLERKKNKYNELQSSQRLNKLVSRNNYFSEEKDTSILVGFILGGASIRNLQVVKQLKDKDRLLKVEEIFKKYNYQTTFRQITTNHGETYQLSVNISPKTAEHYKHQFYPNGNKTVTRHLLNELNDDGLSIWFGINSHEAQGSIILGTLKFTEKENKIIYDYFSVVHKIDVRMRHQRGRVFISFPSSIKDYLSKYSLYSKEHLD